MMRLQYDDDKSSALLHGHSLDIFVGLRTKEGTAKELNLPCWTLLQYTLPLYGFNLMIPLAQIQVLVCSLSTHKEQHYIF